MASDDIKIRRSDAIRLYVGLCSSVADYRYYSVKSHLEVVLKRMGNKLGYLPEAIEADIATELETIKKRKAAQI